MPLGEVQELLDHVTMTAVIQEFRYANLQLADFFCPNPEETKGGDSFAYDILKASRDTAAPKTPGAPSKRVALTPVGDKSGRCIHMAEHKMLDGDRLANVRKMGSRERERVENYVARELRDLERRRRRLRELAVALMLTGTLTISEDDVKASVDYEMDSNHQPTAAASWATSTTDIPDDLDTWIDLVEKDSGYTPEHAWINRKIMRYMMDNTKVKEFLGTAEYKAQVGKLGYIREFHGLTWHIYSQGYVPSGGSFTRYIADDKLILVPQPSPEWVNILNGSTMIANLTSEDLVEVFGEYSHALLEKDPAGYKAIVGDTFIPALFVPDAIVYADVTP